MHTKARTKKVLKTVIGWKYVQYFIISEDCVVYTDLSEEDVLFEGEGDEQFDVYRQMKSHNQ